VRSQISDALMLRPKFLRELAAIRRIMMCDVWPASVGSAKCLLGVAAEREEVARAGCFHGWWRSHTAGLAALAMAVAIFRSQRGSRLSTLACVFLTLIWPMLGGPQCACVSLGRFATVAGLPSSRKRSSGQDRTGPFSPNQLSGNPC